MSWPMIKFSEAISRSGLFSDGDWVESKDQDPEGDVRLIQLADIGVGEFIDKSNRFMTSKRADELRCSYLKAGDILVARMPDPIGRACIFPEDMGRCVTVVDICIVRPDSERIDNRWLMHLINSERFRNQIDRHVTGTTRQRISRGNLAGLEIPLPPLPEQKRIAAILDKADAIRRKRQQAIQLADDFLRAVFLDMFGDPVTNPKGWPKKSLRLLGKSATGRTPPGEKGGMWGEGLPFVTPGDLCGQVDSTVREVTREGAKYSKICRKGSLLVCCIGTVGKVGIAGRSLAFNQQINAQEWGSEIADVYGFFVFKLSPGLVSSKAIQTTLPILKKSLFDEIEIPVPPRGLQEKFSTIAQKISESSLRHESGLNTPLFESLSQLAFSGQL